MTNFLINKNKTFKNSLKDRAMQNNYVGSGNTLTAKTFIPNTFTINNFVKKNINISPTSPVGGINIRNKEPLSVIKVNNYSKILRIRKDTTPIRNNLYDYINNIFIQPTVVDRYEFCYEQKISTIFSTNGMVQWFSSYMDKQPSYKSSLFNRLSYSPLSLDKNCSCRIFNFNGIYSIDRRLQNNNLLFSSNKNISNIQFNFDPIDNYIIISFYSYKTQSYVKTRLRPPLRYRPIYGDWIFDDSVTIDNIMSLTEYTEIINCCQFADNGAILKIK